MKIALIALVCLLTLASVPAQQQQAVAKPSPATLEAHVRKLWQAFKNKDKAALGSALASGFREFEEGTSGFGDKKTEIGMADELDLISYALNDFTVKALGPNAALVTYVAHYESKSGGQTAKADSVFGEVWIHEGSDWKALYVQETYVQGSTAK